MQWDAATHRSASPPGSRTVTQIEIELDCLGHGGDALPLLTATTALGAGLLGYGVLLTAGIDSHRSRPATATLTCR